MPIETREECFDSQMFLRNLHIALSFGRAVNVRRHPLSFLVDLRGSFVPLQTATVWTLIWLVQ